MRTFLPLVLLAVLWSPAVRAVTFDYPVERFSVEGNLPGSLIDEFDDGSQDWFVTPGGTVSESGGSLHLMGPGFQDSTSYANLNPAIVLNRSDAFAPAGFAVADGAGDFTASSTWLNLPDAPSGFYSMGVRYFAPGNLSQGFSLSISDLDQQTANAFGAPAGLVMSYSFFNFDIGTLALLSNDAERFVIDPADVTGNIVLELIFNDTTNEMNAAVSLDGGSTFRTPFGTRAANLQGSANFFLFGDPATVPEPSTGLLVMLGLAGLAARRGR